MPIFFFPLCVRFAGSCFEVLLPGLQDSMMIYVHHDPHLHMDIRGITIGCPFLIITSFYILRPARVIRSVFPVLRGSYCFVRNGTAATQNALIYHRRAPDSPPEKRAQQGEYPSDDDRVDRTKKKRLKECVCNTEVPSNLLWVPTGLNFHTEAEFDFCIFLCASDPSKLFRNTIARWL